MQAEITPAQTSWPDVAIVRTPPGEEPESQSILVGNVTILNLERLPHESDIAFDIRAASAANVARLTVERIMPHVSINGTVL